MRAKRTAKQPTRLKQIGIRICPDLWKNLRRAAFDREISVSKLVGEAILNMINLPAQVKLKRSEIAVASQDQVHKRKRKKPTEAVAAA